jgi:outer membrane biogenesis lipoprotein LolB
MKSLIKLTLLSILAVPLLILIAGCASTEKSETKRVSTVPWNKPQRWEGQGQMGAVADAMGAGRPGGY